MKKTLVDLFELSVKNYPNNTFLLEKSDGKFRPTTYTEVHKLVYRLGAGLQALGVQKGDTMALLSEGRNMWVIGELAMFYAGAINVPLSIKLEESNDLFFRLQHGDVQYVMVSGTQLKKIRQIKDRLPLLKQVIVLDAQEKYEEKEISVFVSRLDPSQVTITLRVWCNTDYYWDVKARVTEAVKKELDANNIEIPFNQLQVHIAK